jgi:hypothetical protein
VAALRRDWAGAEAVQPMQARVEPLEGRSVPVAKSAGAVRWGRAVTVESVESAELAVPQETKGRAVPARAATLQPTALAAPAALEQPGCRAVEREEYRAVEREAAPAQ